MLQDRLKRNLDDSHGRAKRVFTLRGMLFCGRCGKRMSGFSVPKQDWYGYRCTGKYGHYIGMKSCDRPDISGPTTERLVWERVEEFLKDPAVFMSEMQQHHQDQEGRAAAGDPCNDGGQPDRPGDPGSTSTGSCGEVGQRRIGGPAAGFAAAGHPYNRH